MPGDGSSAEGAGLEPTVVDAFGFAWDQLWEQAVLLIGVVLLGALLAVPANVPASAVDPDQVGILYTVSGLWALLVLAPYLFGQAFLFARAAREQAAEFSDAWEGYRNYGSVVVATLAVSVAVAVGLVLLVVPGIWIGLRLSFVPFLVTERGLSPAEAVQESFEQTAGHALSLLGLGLVSILVVLLGGLVFVVGALPGLAVAQLAFAAYYVGGSDATSGSSVSADESAEPA